jgi:hypothetical protein
MNSGEYLQKSHGVKARFQMHDAHLEYAFLDGGGEYSFNARYETLPSSFDYLGLKQKDNSVKIVTTIVFIIWVFQLLNVKTLADMWISLSVMLTMGAVFIGGTFMLRRLWLKRYTAIPVENVGRILVLQDNQHNAIIEDLEVRRRNAYKKIAVVNMANSPVTEWRRLRWLRNQDILEAQELNKFEQQIRAAFPGFSLPAAQNELADDKAIKNDLRFEQRNFLGRIHLTFYSKYLDYSNGKWSFKLRYEDLPAELEYRGITRKSLFAPIICFLTLIGAMIALHWIGLSHSANYYVGPEGGLRVLKFMGIALPIIIGATYMASRYSKISYTVIPTYKGTLEFANDKHKDAIHQELKTRRHEALRRRLAVVDYLNPPQEEMNKFVWLKEQGIITEEELELYRKKLVNIAPLAEESITFREKPLLH